MSLAAVPVFLLARQARPRNLDLVRARRIGPGRARLRLRRLGPGRAVRLPAGAERRVLRRPRPRPPFPAAAARLPRPRRARHVRARPVRRAPGLLSPRGSCSSACWSAACAPLSASRRSSSRRSRSRPSRSSRSARAASWASTECILDLDVASPSWQAGSESTRCCSVYAGGVVLAPGALVGLWLALRRPRSRGGARLRGPGAAHSSWRSCAVRGVRPRRRPHPGTLFLLCGAARRHPLRALRDTRLAAPLRARRCSPPGSSSSPPAFRSPATRRRTGRRTRRFSTRRQARAGARRRRRRLARHRTRHHRAGRSPRAGRPAAEDRHAARARPRAPDALRSHLRGRHVGQPGRTPNGRGRTRSAPSRPSWTPPASRARHWCSRARASAGSPPRISSGIAPWRPSTCSPTPTSPTPSPRPA